MIPYDRMLAGFRDLDGDTLTVYAVAPTYVPDTTHAALTDIDGDDLLGSDTTDVTLVETAGLAALDWTAISIDISAAPSVGWLVVTDASDNLICYTPGPTGTPADPLEPDNTDALLEGRRES